MLWPTVFWNAHFWTGFFFFTLRIHIFAIIQDIACRVICSTNSSVADFLQVVLDNGYKAPNSCAEAVSKLFPENDRAGQVTLDIGAGTGLLAEEVSRVTSTLVLNCYNSAISVTKNKKKTVTQLPLRKRTSVLRSIWLSVLIFFNNDAFLAEKI